ncbi:MAG: ferritin-like protein [Pirellulales bacterium]
MSIVQLMRADAPRDLAWLHEALQAAVELEFFTLPPYLTAMWSIQDQRHPAAATIRAVVEEEMTHMALAANLLAAIGGVPCVNRPPAIPEYPRPMPGGVKPHLVVGLQGLTKEVVRVFMLIEEPAEPLEFEARFAARGETFPRIGAFYDAIQATFHRLAPPLSADRQIAAPLAPLVVTDLDEVDRAIDLIRTQGEGSNVSPADESPEDLAHYYRFQELERGQRLVFDALQQTYRWRGRLPFPEVFPVALVPAGGYRDDEVSTEVAAWSRQFDDAYTHMLDELQAAWDVGGQAALWRAITWMFALKAPARALMAMPIPGTDFTYGPSFRYRGTSRGADAPVVSQGALDGLSRRDQLDLAH